MKLTKEELFAVNQYIGMWYSDINCLMDTGIDSEKVYPQYSNPVFFHDEYKIDDLLKCIEYIYSAMIKMTMNNVPLEKHLFRGTNTSEIEKINSLDLLNKFLSTTTSLDEAIKMFTNSKSGNPAVLVVKANNLPYIDVSKIANDHIHEHEQEIVLAPYIKVNSLTLINNDGTTKMYSCELTKEEFAYLSDDKMTILKQKINDDLKTARSSCYRSIRASKDIIDINNAIETGSNDHTPEQLRAYLQQAKKDYDESLPIYNSWKELISKYLKSSFRKIEHDLGFNPIPNIAEINSNNNHTNSTTDINNDISKDGLPTEGIFKV